MKRSGLEASPLFSTRGEGRGEKLGVVAAPFRAVALPQTTPRAAPSCLEVPPPPKSSSRSADLPPLHQGDLVLDEDSIVQLSAGFGGIRWDQVDLVVPCVLRGQDRQG